MKIYPLNPSSGLDLPTAQTCGLLLDHAYSALRQSRRRGYPSNFVWTPPSPTINGLFYSKVLMAEIKVVVRRQKKQRGGKGKGTKVRSTPLASWRMTIPGCLSSFAAPR